MIAITYRFCECFSWFKIKMFTSGVQADGFKTYLQNKNNFTNPTNISLSRNWKYVLIT